MATSTTAGLLSTNRDLLKIYTYYRLLLSSILLLLSKWALDQDFVGHTSPQLFLIAASTYTAINLTILFALLRTQFHSTVEQTFVVIVIDIFALGLLMHTSGGIASGLGVLIIISVAAGSIFLPKQIATLLAAIATTIIISQSIITSYNEGGNSRDIFQSGLLGMLLFTTSFIFQNLSKRIFTSTQIAIESVEEAARFEQLNHYIVQRMRTGIIVVDHNHQIKVINESAARLLNTDVNESKHLKGTQLPELVKTPMRAWQADRYTKLPSLKAKATAPEFLVNFSRVEENQASDILIFLEETGHITQHAQQIKLASLGRLTASIAHEIRNPLGAISHAAQLMNESDVLDAADKKLTAIIQKHCLRMNGVIENILQLSRRTPSSPQVLVLQDWLKYFIDDYKVTTQEDPEINFVLPDAPLAVKVDPSQLSQVLTNLIDNGIRYSKLNTGRPTITLLGKYHADTETAELDIIDEGKGINSDAMPHLFEPFYTTEKAGTGLGLYICKELCEANQARLGYTINNAGKSCFRINFAHPDRSITVLQQML